MSTRSVASLYLAAAFAVCGSRAVSLPADEPAQRKPAAQILAETVDQTVSAIRKANPNLIAQEPGLFLRNIATGEITLVTPDPDTDIKVAAPAWSPDGARIVFSLLHKERNWRKYQIVDLNVTQPLGIHRHLVNGRYPTFSPHGKRIAYLTEPEPNFEDQAGVSTMLANGGLRRRVGGFGRPQWSPDGRWLLGSSLSHPFEVTLVDVRSADEFATAEFPLEVPGKDFLATPAWAGNGRTIVAVVGDGQEVALEILDISDLKQVRTKLTLLSNTQRGDWTLSDPVYDSRARRCWFVGAKREGKTLLWVDLARPGTIGRPDADVFEEELHDLALSPDGRYLLFCGQLTPRDDLALPGGG